MPLLAAVFRRASRYPITPETTAAPGRDLAPDPLASPSWTLSEALRTPHFWLLFAVYLFTGIGSFLVSLHQLAFAIDVGFDKLYAAGVLGIGSFLAIGGTIVTGTLSDYIGREWSAILAYGMYRNLWEFQSNRVGLPAPGTLDEIVLREARISQWLCHDRQF